MPSQLIRSAVQNLIGGVSQQPNAVRIEGMCEEQINAYGSIVDGLGKRQPTEHINQLSTTGAAYDRDSLIHWVNRDEANRYLLAIEPGDSDPVKAFDLFTGTEHPVTGPNNTAIPQPIRDYLNYGSPLARRDLRAVTIGDVTILCNTKVTCKIDETIVGDGVNVGTAANPVYESWSARRAFLFMRASNYLSKYAVRLNSYTGEHGSLPKNTWDPPRHTTGGQSKQYWLDNTIAWVKTFNGNYATRNPVNLTPGLGAGYGGANDFPPYVPDLNNHANGQWEGKQVGTIQLQELLVRLFKDPREPKTGSAASVYPGGIQTVYDNHQQLGQTFAQVFNLDVTTTKGTPTIVGTVMKIELGFYVRASSFYRSTLKLEVVEQGDSDGNLIAFGDEIERLDLLPLVCHHGHIVKITGASETIDSPFYVEFVVTKPDAETGSDIMGEGYWRESRKSLTRPALDKTTMPVKVSRVPDGAGGFRFELDYIDWTWKLVGDENSNPEPSFVGRTISDVFVWRNRLGFLSGTRVVMSEADEYFNFWRTTVRKLLDSDPIDIDAGHSRVANLRYAVPLEETCVLVTDQQQFVIRGEPLLTPTTASIRETAYFETQPGVRPLGVERGVFYAFPSGGGDYSGVNFLRRFIDTDSFDTFRSSGQIPRYIRGAVTEFTATAIESVLAVRTDDDVHPERIYVHKWHDSGQERLLSAWMSFDIGPEPDSGTNLTEILGMQFINDDLYLLVKRQGNTAPSYNIEVLTFSGQRQTDVGGTYRCCLDRRITEQACTFGFDSSTDEMLITLPYEVAREDYSSTPEVEMLLIERAPGDEGTPHPIASISKVGQVSVLRVDDPGQVLYTKATGGTFYFFVGQTYRMFYEFTQPTLRQRKADGTLGDIKTGRYQLLRGHLSCEDSAGGQVEVRPALHTDGTPNTSRPTRVYPFPQFELGLARSHMDDANVHDDVIRFGIYSIPERVRLIITNDTPYPINPKSLEIEAQYSRRSATRRV